MRELNEIDLTLPLHGNEGLDVNYISRVRTQYLYAQHQALVAQTQFADAKAAALMTLVGLVALRGPLAIETNPLSPFNAAYLGAIAACILFAFIAVFPRYPAKSTRDLMVKADRWSWPALASDKLEGDAFSQFMQTSEVSQLVHSVSLSNSAVSKILLSKFRMLRTAFFFGVIVLIMTGMKFAGFL